MTTTKKRSDIATLLRSWQKAGSKISWTSPSNAAYAGSSANHPVVSICL